EEQKIFVLLHGTQRKCSIQRRYASETSVKVLICSFVVLSSSFVLIYTPLRGCVYCTQIKFYRRKLSNEKDGSAVLIPDENYAKARY
ncbi:MAG: hypothetical protein KBS54_02405, partial [Synergistaceae bacterium]|nr:hypothetical protein [Candidatus Equadaptatus faecalis]